jgi:hypothetical protein
MRKLPAIRQEMACGFMWLINPGRRQSCPLDGRR